MRGKKSTKLKGITNKGMKFLRKINIKRIFKN